GSGCRLPAMPRGGRRILMAAGLAMVALGAMASIARADDSLIRISEIYSDGSAAHKDFIELQLLADGQPIPSSPGPGGATLQICNATHTACGPFFDFPADSSLPAANSERTFTFGWEDNPNFTPDFKIPFNTPAPNLNFFPITGGDVCYYSSA